MHVKYVTELAHKHIYTVYIICRSLKQLKDGKLRVCVRQICRGREKWGINFGN